MSHEEIMRDLQSPQENGKLDLVNVVRCKDCKHCHHTIDARSVDGMIEIDAWECSKLKRKMLPEDYCSYGERRNG